MLYTHTHVHTRHLQTSPLAAQLCATKAFRNNNNKRNSTFIVFSLSKEMRCERATGSVCEVNSTRPQFLKSLQRPVSWTAHFNVSVSGLGEGLGWPLYKAHTVIHPPIPTTPPQPHPPPTTMELLAVRLSQTLN